MNSVSEQVLSLLIFGLLVCIAAGANCGIENDVSLSGKTATESNGAVASNAVDNNVATSVTISFPNTLNISLSTSPSDNWFIKSVQITPARPTHNTGVTAGADKRDTSKCIFPFKKGNVLQNKCVDSGFGFKQCSHGEHIELSDWSSCDDSTGQPDGSLSDNIDVKLSNDELTVSCGNTGNGFNNHRSVNCTNQIINAKRLILSKTSGNLQVANILVTRYTLGTSNKENFMITSGTWAEGSTNATMSVSGCTPDFTIHEIVWKNRSCIEPTILGTKTGTVKSFTMPKITRQHSGFYYFEYRNSNGEVFFKSNEVLKRIHYNSRFGTKFKQKYSGYLGDTVPVICNVELGYPIPNPLPNVTLEIGGTNLPCTNNRKTECEVESLSCATNLTIKSEYNNLKLICKNQQTGENLTATVTALSCISTATAVTQNTTAEPTTVESLSPGGIASIILAFVVVGAIVTIFIICCCCKPVNIVGVQCFSANINEQSTIMSNNNNTEIIIDNKNIFGSNCDKP